MLVCRQFYWATIWNSTLVLIPILIVNSHFHGYLVLKHLLHVLKVVVGRKQLIALLLQLCCPESELTQCNFCLLWQNTCYYKLLIPCENTLIQIQWIYKQISIWPQLWWPLIIKHTHILTCNQIHTHTHAYSSRCTDIHTNTCMYTYWITQTHTS